MRGAGVERDNRGDVFAVLQLARSAQQSVLHLVQSPLSVSPRLSPTTAQASSRFAAPAAVLLPADDFNVRSQRPEHKSFYGNFIPSAAHSLTRSLAGSGSARGRRYKSTITNGRVN